jgi:hypothetical protein
MPADLNDLLKKADEYAAAQLAQWHVEIGDPRRPTLYPAVFNSHLAFLLEQLGNEPTVQMLNDSGIFPPRIACSNSVTLPEPEPSREELITLLDDILKHIYLSGPIISTELQARIEDALIRPEYN